MKRVSPTNEGAPVPKRTKASQACASCRRQKSRCEILDVRGAQAGTPVTVRCHRCKVLGVECSFETSDLIHFLPKPAATSTSPAASVAVSPSEDLMQVDSYGGLNTLAAVASSRPKSSETAAVKSIPSRYGMLPEDLVPTATTPIWGCTSRVDWTATPMLAIQELVRFPRTEGGPEVISGRLADILSPSEITSLLEIFETRYSPWLAAQPGSLECTYSLLDIVRCTIASRHLDLGFRSAVAPRLQKLAEEVFLREIFNPQPSMESIKALLILSVWSPICGTGAEARDGRLLIASAVSMAMNLHLENASKEAISLRAEKEGLGADHSAEIEELTDKWRLWMLLSTSESLLCIGTGRTPVSHRSQLDRDMTSLAALPNLTLSSVRDARLGLIGKMYDVAQTALQARLKRAEDLGTFFHSINSMASTMEGLSRHLTPLPVITEHDVFYSHMLILQYHACRLLLMHHALRETRTAWERDSPSSHWYEARTQDQCVCMTWGRVALISAEAVLTSFLARLDLTLMSTAPDNIYIMVAFAGTWLYVSNFSLHQLGGSRLGGASEILQKMSIERLTALAHAPEHSAARCGHVLGALHAAWERRQPRPNTEKDWQCVLEPYDSFKPETVIPAASTDYSTAPPLFPESATNSDLFMDDAFWASFIENLNSDTFIAQNSGATV
ncbi:hypothetical protein B0H10DRAFT_2003701 [Mycena sp. CBHHK59/15]|nr:hypothetical protein B0H10DRAFT_2003701 [Mycena sp. CBHHK59/15]